MTNNPSFRQKAAAVIAADLYRKQEAAEHRHRPAGVVLVNSSGKVYGWKNELRDPQQEAPGSFAVDINGTVFVATGGDDYNGATSWEQV